MQRIFQILFWAGMIFSVNSDICIELERELISSSNSTQVDTVLNLFVVNENLVRISNALLHSEFNNFFVTFWFLIFVFIPLYRF